METIDYYFRYIWRNLLILVFSEDIAIVESQFPEDLPLNLQEEAHFAADRSSITYRKGLASLGLGRHYTA